MPNMVESRDFIKRFKNYKKFRYFVSYMFCSNSNWGFGRCFIERNRKIEDCDVEEFCNLEKDIAESNGFDRVSLVNFQRLKLRGD